MLVVAILLIGLFVLGALRLRARASRLAVLPDSATPVSTDHRFLTLRGVTLDRGTQQAASAYARAAGLDVLDLLPQRAPFTLLLSALELVDPSGRWQRFAKGRTAGQAILVSDRVLQCLGKDVKTLVDGSSTDAAAFAGLAEELKRCAPLTTSVAVAPGLLPRPENASERRALARVLFGRAAIAVLLVQLAIYGAEIACLLLRPGWGLAVLAAHHLQPCLALTVPQLAPQRLGLALVARLPLDLWLWLRTLLGDPRDPIPRSEIDARRRTYAELAPDGVAALFEPRRPTCAWCGSPALRPWLASREHWQKKPGVFHLERCTACGHVFQNPRLSFRGLDYYYRDFYDGLGEDNLEFVFSLGPSVYWQRARTVEGLAEPKRWLDVGGGHGHFCLAAQDVWPDTRFEVLDMADSPAAAERRGWCAKGWRGTLPALAADLTGKFDVVSMSHYLEHTPDPKEELDAAARVLTPNGLLLIEVPDPESPFGRVLKSNWLPWFQPQHLHLLSAANLERALQARGLEPIRWLRHGAHQPCDFLFLLAILAHRLTVRFDKPWRPPTSPLWWPWNAAIWALMIALLPLAATLDLASKPLVKPLRLANTYRVVARKTA